MKEQKKRYLFYCSELYCLPILRPLQKCIWSRGDEVAWFFDSALRSEVSFQENERHLTSLQAVIDYQPEAVFVPGNHVPDFIPGLKIQVFHGLANDFIGKKNHFKIRGFFDLYCTRGPEETRIFQKLAQKHKHFEVCETGWPKLDPLFQKRVQPLPGLEPENKNKPVILYAPTFSPSLTSAPALFNTVERLAQEGPFLWLITLHPKMDPKIAEAYRELAGEHLWFFETTEDRWSLFQSADVMLSDTSTVMLEFMLFNKPVITYRTPHPGNHLINIQSPEELESTLNRALQPSPEILANARSFIQKLHYPTDGRSSERVLEATEDLLKRGTAHLKRKPLNLFRKLKLRKQLGFR